MNKASYYTLSAFPLSEKFQKILEQKCGNPIINLTISDFRNPTLRKAWQSFRRIKSSHLFLTLEHKNHKLFLDSLKVLTLFIKTNRITIVYEDFTFHSIHKASILISVLTLAHQSIKSWFSLLRCKIEVNCSFNFAVKTTPKINSKNILYLDATVWFSAIAGGSAGHIAGIINSLANHGYQVDYAAADKVPLLSEEINFFQIPLPNRFVYPAELNRFYLNNKMFDQFSKKTKNYQFIYQRLSLENYAGLKLSKKLKIPLIIEYNGSSIWISKNWGKKLFFSEFAERCELICLRHADLVVTISEVLKEELVQLGISENRIVCYPNGINPSIFDPNRFNQSIKSSLKKILSIPEDTLVISFIGTFGDWHGVDILAEAIKKFIDQRVNSLENFSVRFVLVGNGIKMPLIKQILDKPIYLENVVFTDTVPQEQAAQYLAISDIFLSPHIPNPDGSRFFGSPTKLFEYMCMGKAIIASDLEQIGRVLKNSLHSDNLPTIPPSANSSELAILCEPGNPDHIITAIKFLINNPKWRKILGENARKEALAKYTWDQHVKIILEQFATCA